MNFTNRASESVSYIIPMFGLDTCIQYIYLIHDDQQLTQVVVSDLAEEGVGGRGRRGHRSSPLIVVRHLDHSFKWIFLITLMRISYRLLTWRPFIKLSHYDQSDRFWVIWNLQFELGFVLCFLFCVLCFVFCVLFSFPTNKWPSPFLSPYLWVESVHSRKKTVWS